VAQRALLGDLPKSRTPAEKCNVTTVLYAYHDWIFDLQAMARLRSR
jgi:hypothetical protein